ncbi:hypothetical protein CFE70_001289 [Pyrenophora teres f. teres 0-1]
MASGIDASFQHPLQQRLAGGCPVKPAMAHSSSALMTQCLPWKPVLQLAGPPPVCLSDGLPFVAPATVTAGAPVPWYDTAAMTG